MVSGTTPQMTFADGKELHEEHEILGFEGNVLVADNAAVLVCDDFAQGSGIRQ